MKAKLLIVYGYLIPFIKGAVVSGLPWIFKFISYKEISNYFSTNTEMLLAFLAVIAAITWPFQSAIINENDPYVLAVLKKKDVRKVFVASSIFQAVVIIILTLLIFILSSKGNPSSTYGYIELFASSIITFESIALITNGRSYGNIREQIIIEAAKMTQNKTIQK